MIVNGINLNKVKRENITPMQFKCMIAEAKVRAREYALQIFRRQQ